MSADIDPSTFGSLVGEIVAQLVKQVLPVWADKLAASPKACCIVALAYSNNEAISLRYPQLYGSEFSSAAQSAARQACHRLFAPSPARDKFEALIADRTLHWKLATDTCRDRCDLSLLSQFLYASLSKPELKFDFHEMKPSPEDLEHFSGMLTEEGRKELDMARTGQCPTYPMDPSKDTCAIDLLLATRTEVIRIMQQQLGA